MSSTNQAVARSPVPVDPRQRIKVVDMVRGFALFGALKGHSRRSIFDLTFILS